MSLWLRIALGAGILGLMTTKPGIAGSLLILAIALVIGLAGGLRSGRTSLRPAESLKAGVLPMNHDERAAG
jgi:hypothetical protein